MSPGNSNSSQAGEDHAWFMAIFSMARRIAGARSARAWSKMPTVVMNREDVQQEVLTAIWVALPRYDRARGSLRTFLERVVAARVASLLRRTSRQLRFERISIDPPASDMVAALELRVDLQSVCGSLIERDRELAFFLMQYSPAEAGRVMGVSRSEIYRAIGRVRVALVQAGLGSGRNEPLACTANSLLTSSKVIEPEERHRPSPRIDVRQLSTSE
jgi:RNA polymerase sigma factor (sigma-70 family)